MRVENVGAESPQLADEKTGRPRIEATRTPQGPNAELRRMAALHERAVVASGEEKYLVPSPGLLAGENVAENLGASQFGLGDELEDAQGTSGPKAEFEGSTVAHRRSCDGVNRMEAPIPGAVPWVPDPGGSGPGGILSSEKTCFFSTLTSVSIDP
jgi:hypothetical protein